MDRLAQFSIHDAAQICGLTPSVIRVWEERYGWPSPKRQHNGYRAFSALEIDELKRVAVLVKSGKPISQIIVDGLPVFPKDTSRPPPQHDLQFTRNLPPCSSRVAAAYRSSLVEALEQRHEGRVLESIQRACIELRPADELVAVLVPALVGVIELRHHDRTLSRESNVLRLIGERGAQLARRFPTTGEPISLGALTAADRPLAELVAALLAHRGQSSKILPEGGPAKVIASLHPSRPTGDSTTVVTALPSEGCVPLAHLTETNRPRNALLDLTPIPVLSAG